MPGEGPRLDRATHFTLRWLSIHGDRGGQALGLAVLPKPPGPDTPAPGMGNSSILFLNEFNESL